MPQAASALAIEEFRALRATIRERGTARVVIAIGVFVSWAALALVVAVFASTPGATLVPLVVLAAGFEAVVALHVGVERIGRYLQVKYEDDGLVLPAWERTSMRLPRPAAPGGALDPVFSGLFVLATLVNLAPAALASIGGVPSLGGVPIELLVYGILHLAFVMRVIQTRRFSSSLRQRELETFQRDVVSKG